MGKTRNLAFIDSKTRYTLFFCHTRLRYCTSPNDSQIPRNSHNQTHCERASFLRRIWQTTRQPYANVTGQKFGRSCRHATPEVEAYFVERQEGIPRLWGPYRSGWPSLTCYLSSIHLHVIKTKSARQNPAAKMNSVTWVVKFQMGHQNFSLCYALMRLQTTHGDIFKQQHC